MATPLPQLLAACAFALASIGMCANASAAAPAKAAATHPKAEAVLKAQAKADAKSKGKAKKGAKASKADAAADASVRAAAAYDAAEETEPDITDTVTTEYACELNNKVTIYTNETDPANIALRWKKRVHRLTRVGTTTGALRFENPYWGLIWIGIPSKGILLDSRLNRQLANECKNAKQAEPLAPVTAALPEEKKS